MHNLTSGNRKIQLDRSRLKEERSADASRRNKGHRKPTLEIASCLLFFAGKCNFRLLLSKQVGNLLVRDFADLIVVFNEFTILVADTSAASLHQGITSLVRCADIAVDASPAFVAIARRARSHRSVFAAPQRATH
jgi:hypothetical protein